MEPDLLPRSTRGLPCTAVAEIPRTKRKTHTSKGERAPNARCTDAAGFPPRALRNAFAAHRLCSFRVRACASAFLPRVFNARRGNIERLEKGKHAPPEGTKGKRKEGKGGATPSERGGGEDGWVATA